MGNPSLVKHTRLLGIALFCVFAILCCSVGAFILWRTDPFNFRAPSDQELIATLNEHQEGFEALRQVKAAQKKPDYAKLATVPPVLTIGGHDGVTRFVFAEGGLLAVGPGWAKGIEYVPGDYEKEGDIQQNLDSARKLPPGVYLRQIEPHWFIFYQRDE